MPTPAAPAIIHGHPPRLDIETDVLVIGAGACGLTAALRATALGADVVVVERDSSPRGSTSMSSGFVPAPATRFQRAAGIGDDSAETFVADIQSKSKGRSVPQLAERAAHTIGPAVEWLSDEAGIEWIVLDDFLYPGHSRHRMHAVPEKTGEALMARLLSAAEDKQIPIVTAARCHTLYFQDDSTVCAAQIVRPDGTSEIIGAKGIVLACNGFGGNKALVAEHIPEIADGLYYGHEGNTGDALLWGKALQAKTEHLSAYQGHGSLAHPHGILISWALMMEGGVQVNTKGERFSNEHGGYSEQAVNVLAQPGGIAWNVYDQRLHYFAQTFPDYREAMTAGAVRTCESIPELAASLKVPEEPLRQTLKEMEDLCQSGEKDPFGRSFQKKPPLTPPYHAIKVTGALFHTQGGLLIDEQTRVIGSEGRSFANLFAGGGAACGVSGPDVSGYLSGNGLLTAIAFGWIAGEQAARRRDTP